MDLPFAVSPVVIGLALILVYGRNGWFGDWLIDHGIRVIFSTPGMILATIFVSLPFVAREVVPVLREIGTEQEQAAETLGASPWQTFWRITLPAIRWGVAYGVVLTTARALGEFGALSIVSGKLSGRTETLTLFVENRVPALRSDGRLRSVGSLGGPRSRGASVHEPAEAERGSLMGSRWRTCPSGTATSSRSTTCPSTVRDGSLTALLGPSGGGKSTLSEGIAGLEEPDEGGS